MAISPIEALNIPPEVADRLRERRPGYERLAALVVEFDSISRSKSAFDLPAEDIAKRFVIPALEALGWKLSVIEEAPFWGSQNQVFPIIIEYRGLKVVVGVYASGVLNDEHGIIADLMDWASDVSGENALLTNFNEFQFLKFGHKGNSQDQDLLGTETILESRRKFAIRDYLTNESSEFDILAAEQFYNFAAADVRQSHASIPLNRQQNIAEQTSFPGEPPAEPASPPPDLIAPYGEPDGPRRRYTTVMPGVAFQSEGLPQRTITALVLDRDSQKPRLLLAGGDIPAAAKIIQPALDSGDLIGEVERRLFDSAIGLGALASLGGERSFLSLLPSSRPIAGVAPPAENLPVCKFGGGSGYTAGRITTLDSRVTLTDDSQRNILLSNAFIVGSDAPFSDRGDIGAPVLAIDTNELVGVVVGYNNSGTVCLPIQPILNALNVTLVTEPVLFFRERTPSHDLSATNDLIFGRDRLGFSHYVSAFVSLISDKNTRPPLTVGIYGAWGTGKSFLMHKIACALKPQDCPDEMDEPPTAAALSLAAKTVLVKFEAWDYNGSDKLWAGLVERIFSALEQELGWYWQLKFNFWRNLKRLWQQARQKFLPYALISLALALVVVWLLLEPANRAAIATGGVITFLLLFVPQLIKLFSTSASQRVIDMFAAQDYKADIGFMGRIKSDLRDFADNLPPTTKVIVFIDDLDRCDPKKAVEVLEAVKLLLELKQFIVFLALDARIITQAVEEYYGKVLTEAEITGYEYLDKIVQIPFSIPEPRPGELRNYLGSLMGLSEAQVTALEPEIAPPAPEFVARHVTTPPPVVSAPARGDSQPGEASPPPAATGQPAGDAGQPSPRPAPPAGQTESPAKPATPTPRPFDTIEVPFTPDEQKAFLRLYPHLDPNPRRLKRLVNIYRLVRMLLRSQPDGQVADFVNTPVGQSHVLAWLVLCEQWPYASHIMLEEIDQQFKAAQTDADARLALEQKTISSIYPVTQQRLADDDNEALQKLDLKYERLEAFLNQHLADFALADLRRLRPFTINFNPALSAEVRLTLAHH